MVLLSARSRNLTSQSASFLTFRPLDMAPNVPGPWPPTPISAAPNVSLGGVNPCPPSTWRGTIMNGLKTVLAAALVLRKRRRVSVPGGEPVLSGGGVDMRSRDAQTPLAPGTRRALSRMKLNGLSIRRRLAAAANEGGRRLTGKHALSRMRLMNPK